MRNRIAALTALAILSAGLGAAAAISQFGQVRGTAELTGPLFYAAESGESVGNSRLELYSLSRNLPDNGSAAISGAPPDQAPPWRIDFLAENQSFGSIYAAEYGFRVSASGPRQELVSSIFAAESCGNCRGAKRYKGSPREICSTTLELENGTAEGSCTAGPQELREGEVLLWRLELPPGDRRHPVNVSLDGSTSLRLDRR